MSRSSYFSVSFLYFALFFLFGITMLPAQAQNTYTIIDLGTIDGDRSSDGLAINAHGQVTGWSWSEGQPGSHGFRTQPSQPINTATDAISLAMGRGINDSGAVVGFWYVGTGGDAARLDPIDASHFTTVDLGFLPGDLGSDAYAINASGQATGLSAPGAGATRAFRTAPYGKITDPSCVILSSLVGSTDGFSINASGQITGLTDLITTWHAFRSTGNGVPVMLTDLGTLGGSHSIGYAINNAGQVAGVSDLPGDSVHHAFRTTATGLVSDPGTDLGTLGGASSTGYGINNAGWVVGMSDTSTQSQHAFIYTDHMVDLNSLIPADTGWILTIARAINDLGQITGKGFNKYGYEHAFLLTPADLHTVNTSLDMKADYPGGGSVLGIVCDNLHNMAPELKDRLKITLPKYPDADFTGTQVIGINPGTVDTTQPGVLYYYPPDEFNEDPEPDSVDKVTKGDTRQVALAVHFTSGGERYLVDTLNTITLARPPVVLVHGINSSPLNFGNGPFCWKPLRDYFTGQHIQVPFTAVDHWDQVFDGNDPVELAAWKLYICISDTLNCIGNGLPIPFIHFTQNNIDFFTDYAHLDPAHPDSSTPLAIRRVDVVGWSYGGVVTRWYIASDGSDPSKPNDPGKSWYKRLYEFSSPTLPAYNGTIRKFITLGSMWRGVPLVNYLNEVAFNAYPSPSGVYLGNAPISATLDTILGKATGVHNLQQLASYLDANTPVKAFVPSMEVMAVNSPWLSYMIFRDPFQTNRALIPRPFDPTIAYGSVAGDNEQYLLSLVSAYDLLNRAQQPSWFPFLRLEHLSGASRNYSDGLVPVWSAAIPGSYKIAPVSHGNYPADPDTRAYLAQWLNNAALPTGATLNQMWNTSVQTFDLSKTWTFQVEEMAPHTQNILYPQLGGIGRINPSAIQGNNTSKPVIKIARVGTPTFNNGMSFVLSVSNTGAPANGFTITSISFYQSLTGLRLPYHVLNYPPAIDFLGPPQNLTINVTSKTDFASPLFCTVNYYYYDEKENLIPGFTPSIRLR